MSEQKTTSVHDAVHDAVRTAIDKIDSGRFQMWYALPAGQVTVEQVRAEIAAAGRSGDLGARRQYIGNIGDMIMVFAKRANSVAFLVRAFINSGEAQQWYHFPATGRCGDRAHRAQSVKQAIWRAGLAGQIGYGITDEGYLHLFRRDSIMDATD